MDLRQMRYFLAVAEELHFRRAAEKLHLSQPSLSQQIRQMEEELGVKLFERTNRKVQLTQAGEAFLPRVRNILQGMDDAVQEIGRIDQGLGGVLTISFVSTALVGVLPTVMKILQTQAPGVELQLKECEPKEQIASILHGTADIGFMHAKLDDDQLASIVIQRDELVVALPSDIQEDGPVDLHNYIQYAAIMPSPFTAFGFYNHVQRAYHLAGLTPSKIIYTNLIIGGINLVAAGMGIALVPASFQYIQVKGVIYRPLMTPPPAVKLLAVWRRNSTSKLLQRFLEILKHCS
jgi:DNA-binding transcriptional LysR family regulator